MPKSWMVFQMEGTINTYFWTGEKAILVHKEPAESSINLAWYKGLDNSYDIPENEVRELNKYAETPRKQVFEMKRVSQRRFIIKARGKFPETGEE